MVEPLANVLNKLGSNHVLVVHSEDGMDEISVGAPTFVAELKDGKVDSYTIQPEDFGMTRTDIAALAVDGAEASLAVVRSVLAGEPGPAADIVALNAGAAIYAAGLADSLASGIKKAQEVIASGAGAEKLEALAKLSNSFS
jgi:anthranilate phosphoribosyltransferase